jgi:hypothetical protein
MKNFAVHEIVNEAHVIHGIAATNNVVLYNVALMFGEDKAKYIFTLSEAGEDFYSVDRYCQYVGFLQYQEGIGFSLKLSDFKSDIDNALDEYLMLEHNGWGKVEMDKYVSIVQQIAKEGNRGEQATLNVIPIVPDSVRL